MQKFKFSLEKMLSYRDQLLNREKNSLRQLQSAKTQLEDRRDRLLKEEKATGAKLRGEIAGGVTVAELKSTSYIIESSRRAVGKIRDDIAKLEPAIEKQRQIVMKASQDHAVLEKLRERQLEEYTAAAARQERADVIEFVTNALVYDNDEE